MRIYAERRPNEFQEQHFPVHPNEALRRCHPGPLTTTPRPHKHHLYPVQVRNSECPHNRNPPVSGGRWR